MTIKKLIIVHQTLPILNVQFLHILLLSINRLREKQGRFDVQVFNLNIAGLGLPQVDNPGLVDAYETAFSFEVADMVQEAAASGKAGDKEP